MTLTTGWQVSSLTKEIGVITVNIGGWSPEVMRGYSCSEGRGFESQLLILDGYFSLTFVVKLECLFEKMEINEKEAEDGSFLKLVTLTSH